MTTPKKLKIVVLISGHGSNLQAIIDATHRGLAVEISAVISNRPHVYGLERARHAGIPTHTLPHQQFDTRSAFEEALACQIDHYQPDLVVLAGFMRQLTADFVKHYYGRMINIHPSLLPKYPGLNTHQRVLDAGETLHGVSIHYVNEQIDGGPVICQATINVEKQDSALTLQQRVHELEHQLYPQVLALIAAGRLVLRSSGVYLDGALLTKPPEY